MVTAALQRRSYVNLPFGVLAGLQLSHLDFALNTTELHKAAQETSCLQCDLSRAETEDASDFACEAVFV